MKRQASASLELIALTSRRGYTNGYNRPPKTPTQRITSAKVGESKSLESPCFPLACVVARTDKMSDDAKFILGFG